MTWTYDGAPGTDDAAGRRDAVRLLIGDTDTNDQQTTDEEIAFTLSQASNNVYRAAAISCRTLAAKYAKLVDTSIESVRSAYSQRQQNFASLAGQLEAQAAKYSGTGLGGVVVGGVSISTMDGVRDDADRVDSKFRQGQFDNPNYRDDTDLTRR